MIPLRTILVAADFSESSRQAFRVACSLARVDKTRIFVLNVTEPKHVPDTQVQYRQRTVYYMRVAWNPTEHESLKQRLREAYASDQPLDVQYLEKEGDAAEEILRSCEEVRCDLIVMGAHGRSGLGRLLMGSIAESVLRGANCPVLSVKVPLTDSASAPGQPARRPAIAR
jgi:nucleotide-binding universal stress UspA family protein